MSRAIPPVLLSLAFGVTALAQTPDLSGTWKLDRPASTISNQKYSAPARCSPKQHHAVSRSDERRRPGAREFAYGLTRLRRPAP